MTREEAIKELQESLDTLREYDIAHSSRLKQALEMAIQALEQTDIEQKAQEYEKAFMDGFESCSDLFTRNKEQQPCEDAISRDELLKAIDTWDKFGYTETGCFVREPKGDYVPYIHYDDVIKCIKGMPSVTQKPIECDDAISRDAVIEATHHCGDLQEVRGVVQQLPSVTQKSGKWITDEPTVLEPYVCSECGIFHNGKYKNFCPNCGAKMESEDKV